jgi:hypothetical protein
MGDRYRLKPGKKHAGVEPGQEVELTETQALAFRDKFEKVGAPPAPEPPKKDDKPKATSSVPQDAGSADPLRNDPNPGNKIPITAR